MRCLWLAALIVSLQAHPGVAAPLSRADHMKLCAKQWSEQKAARSASGQKYQQFMGDCMKSVAQARPAHA